MIQALYAKLRGWLERPHADRFVLWLGFVLLLPSLDTGLGADDYLHTLMLDRPVKIEGFERAPFDIFRFCDPLRSPALLRQGIFSWWDDPNTRLGFMRPVTAATHIFDHAFFRNVGWFMHLHSALWALLLLAGVRALYREWIDDRLLGNLAFALYALDDARGWLVSWVAARNAAVATALSVWALVAHVRERSGRLRTGQTLGPAIFAAALLAGEGSASICAYLLGHALFIDSGHWRTRLLRLWPYAAVIVVWRIAYRALDYGVYGSTMYLDPQHDPLPYLERLLTYGPVLLGAQFGALWSDTWNLLFVAPKLRAAVYVGTLLGVLGMSVVLFQQARGKPVLYACALGALGSLVPASAVYPADRMLTWIGVGASVLLANVLVPLLRPAPAGAPAAVSDSRWLRGLLTVVLGSHLIGIGFLPSRARGNLLLRDFFGRAEAAIPRDPSVTDKTLIFVNPPFFAFAAYIPMERAALDVPRPKAQHILGSSTTDISVERIDAHTLRMRPDRGFLLEPSTKLMWSPHRPFSVGERITQGDMVVLVTQITEDHRPLEVELTFALPLEDPSYIWCDWRGATSHRFVPPKIGERIVLPGADYIEALSGKPMLIHAKL